MSEDRKQGTGKHPHNSSADPREHQQSSTGRGEGGRPEHGGRSSGTIGSEEGRSGVHHGSHEISELESSDSSRSESSRGEQQGGHEHEQHRRAS